jgi:hypothetical protein
MDHTITSMMPRQTAEIEVPKDSKKLKLAEMLANGYTTKQISDELGMSEAWVREHKKDTDVVSLVTGLQFESLESARHQIMNSTTLAAKTLVSLLKDDSAKIRLAASKDILDRVGLSAPDKKQIDATIKVEDNRDEQLSRIRERMARLGLNIGGGEIIDVTPE